VSVFVVDRRMTQGQTATTAEPIYSVFRDEDDFRELLEEFVSHVAERREVLESCYAMGQIGTVRVQAHQLKGAGGGYGFEELTELAARLEEACKRNEPDLNEIGPLLDNVVDYLGRVRV
jgi:histidine phosphotransfer protein HptB